MLIVNGGVPRSGTVWVGTVICEVLKQLGQTWKRYNPQERRFLPEFKDRVDSWPTDGPSLLIHTHIADRDVLAALEARPDALAFWNHRDPRDVVVSLQKLHDLPLDHTIEAVGIYFEIERLVSHSPAIQRLRYENIMSDRKAAVFLIAQRMGVTLSEDQATAIFERTSVERHSEIMRDVADEKLPNLRIQQTRHRILREDTNTLINDRHIQSGAWGRWQTELSGADLEQVQTTFAPLVSHYGYDRLDMQGRQPG